MNTSLGLIAPFGGTFLGVLMQRALTAASYFLLARFMGVEGYGILALSISIILILQVFSIMGINHAIVRFGAEYAGDAQRFRKLILVGYGVTTTLSLSLALILGMTTSYWFGFYSDRPVAEECMIILLIGLPFTTFTITSSSVANATMNFGIQQRILLVGPAILLFLTISFKSSLNGDPILAAKLYTTSSMLACLLAAIQIRPLIKSVATNPVTIRFNPFFSFAIVNFVIDASFILWTYIDRVMISAYLDPANVAVYDIAARVAAFLTIGITASSTVIMPSAVRLYRELKISELQTQFRDVIRWSHTATLPLVIVFVVSPSMVLDFFGSGYAEGSFVLMLLAVTHLVACSTGPTGKLLNVLGKEKLALAVSVLHLIANVVGNSILIPLYGILGAALASLSSLVLAKSIAIVLCYQDINLGIFSQRAQIPLIYATVSIAIGFFAQLALSLSVLSHLAATLVVFAGLLVRDSYTREDFADFTRRFRKG